MRKAVAVILFLALAVKVPAQAHHRRINPIVQSIGFGLGHMLDTMGRPRAWCGWFMRSQVGADPGPQYNLARNWAHWGSNAGGPGYGVIVVWPHHVGKIVGPCNGQVCPIESGNDGRAVRTRNLSVAGAIAFRR